MLCSVALFGDGPVALFRNLVIRSIRTVHPLFAMAQSSGSPRNSPTALLSRVADEEVHQRHADAGGEAHVTPQSRVAVPRIQGVRHNLRVRYARSQLADEQDVEDW